MSPMAAIHGIVARDLLRAYRQKGRLLGGLARPFMWLLLVGTGFNAIAEVEGAVSYHAFVFPGVVVMSVLFGAMLASIATVYDREFGMLRLMLASPAGPWAVLTGRAVAAAAVGLVQGTLVLLAAPLFLPVGIGHLAAALPVVLLASASASVLGLLVAAPLRSVENFAGVINLVLFPLLFLSGALYPTRALPAVLAVAAQANPVTYAVDLLRVALGMPGEFAILRSVSTLLVATAAAFLAAALLFDPERRFTAPGRRPTR
jgi:ABC-2 type transport system permease protein